MRFALRRCVGLAIVLALAGSCAEPLCGCSWVSGAVVYGTVRTAASETPVAGATLDFVVYDGGRPDRGCAAGGAPLRALGSDTTGPDGGYRHLLLLGMATPRAACVVAHASPPDGADTLGHGQPAGGPLRFEVCGDECGRDSIRLDVELPAAP
jgi:hypothetical protein